MIGDWPVPRIERIGTVDRRRLARMSVPGLAGDLHHDLGTHSLAVEIEGTGSRFGMMHLTGDRVYWFATAPAPASEPEVPEQRQAEVLRRFGGWMEPVEALVRATAPGDILRHDLYDRPPV